MEDELLYRGRFDHVGDRKLNSIRLFVSSTFTGNFFGDNNYYRIFYAMLYS